MAAALANNIFASRGMSAVAASCGVFAIDDADASRNAVAAMENGWSVDISDHRARIAREEYLQKAHIVIAMTAGHKNGLCSVYPQYTDKIYAVREFGGDCRDIDDPFGANLEIYQECAKQIEDFLENFDWEGYL